MDTYRQLISELQDDLDDSEVMGKSRVIDHLLDLRLAAAANPARVASIDEALGEAPGKNMVPMSWWRDRLMVLELDPAPEPVG